MKYIYLYQNENEYNADSTRVLPSVSFSEETQTTHYAPADGSEPTNSTPTTPTDPTEPTQHNLSDYITFDDPVVEQIIVDEFGSNDHITYRQAAAVKQWFSYSVDNPSNSYDPFFNNKDVTSFNEFQYFTRITEIGEAAFALSNIKDIILPPSVVSIGNSSFGKCPIESITLPTSLRTIDDHAFTGTSLTSIYIPRNVSTIGEAVFSSCDNITSITVDENNLDYDSRENCNGIIESATNTMIAGCKTTVIPDTVTTLYRTFESCRGLTSIDIPNSVTNIGYNTFNGCTGLTTITLPNSVDTIGMQPFDNNLTSITCLAETPPTLETSGIFGHNASYPIYVPAESVDTYKAAWVDYADRIFPITA